MNTKETKIPESSFFGFQEQEVIIRAILEKYYGTLNQEIQENKSYCDWQQESLLPSYIMAIGEGYNFLFHKEKWLDNAYILLDILKEAISNNPYFRISFFYGLSEIAFGTMILSLKSKEFCTFLKSINEYLCKIVKQRLKYLNQPYYVTRMDDYDVIFGMSGIGRYLLSYIDHYKEFRDCEDERDTLCGILHYLIHLSTDKSVNNDQIMRFHVSAQDQFRADEVIRYPKGNLNFGLAHGMAGPLALMTYAAERGIVVENQKSAIKKLIRLYNAFSFYDNHIIRWPTRLSFEDYMNRHVHSDYDDKMGWCYGNIGVTRVLYRASQCVALDSQIYLDGLKNIAQLSLCKMNLYSPTLCHGYSGVLLILNATCQENPNIVEFKKGIDHVLDHILSCYDPSLRYGFKNIDLKKGLLVEDENSYYLNGTTGIAMTLLSLISVNTFHEEHLMVR